MTYFWKQKKSNKTHLPNRAFVAPEIGDPGLGPFLDLEDLDCSIRGAGGQSRAVVVHLGIVDHVLQ